MFGTWIFLGLTLASFLGYGLYHLGHFQTADEDLWIANLETGRVHRYFEAWEYRLWEKTRINDKPGVTTALLSGLVGLQVDDEPGRKATKVDGGPERIYDVPYNIKTHFFFRLPILLANAVLLMTFFYCLWRFTQSEELALLATMLAALSPILVGISQIVNPDATVWSFGIVSFLAFLVYLREGGAGFLAVAGILSGFALLSKYSATFFLLFAFFAIFAYLFFQREEFSDAKSLGAYLKRALLGYAAFVVLTLLIFSLFMPAVFTNPEFIYQGTLGFKLSNNTLPLLAVLIALFLMLLLDTFALRSRLASYVLRKTAYLEWPLLALFCVLPAFLIIFSTINWSLGNLIDLPDPAFDLGRFKGKRYEDWEKILLEFRVLPFTVTPLVLLFSVYGLLFGWMEKRYRFLVFTLGAFTVFFYAAVLYQDLLVHVRYGIFLYPVTAILAAIGLLHFLGLFTKNRALILAALGMAFALSLFHLHFSKPFYFNYTNSLLPPEDLVTGAWGYGGYEAAQVLNQLPNARDLVVWTDYDGFCPFFVGQCMRGTTVKKYAGETYRDIDYFIMSRRGRKVNINIWKRIEQHKLIVKDEPDWNLSILHRDGNYVRIYQAHQDQWQPLPLKKKADK